jgi:hypothetical protein
MKRFLFFLAILLPGLLMAQKKVQHHTKVQKNHPDSTLAKRMLPKNCTIGKILVQPLGKETETIVVYDDSSSYQAYVYLFSATGTAVIVDTLGPGLFGYPEVTSVAYSNTDKDPEKELIIRYTLGARQPNQKDDGYDEVRVNMIDVYDIKMSGNKLVSGQKLINS